MINNSIKKWILNITKTPIAFNHRLADYTSFRIGGLADAIVFPDSIKEIIKVVIGATTLGIPITILGGGSNTLVKDNGIEGIILIISDWTLTNKSLRQADNFIVLKVASGVNLRTICDFSIKNNLLGTNFALGIPGTIGGAIAMNTGTANGSISNILRSVTLLSQNGKVKKLNKPLPNLHYENWIKIKKSNIILECEINLIQGSNKAIRKEAKSVLKKRKNTQPINSASAGCFFKNPNSNLSAGELIDKTGLKGTQIGDAMISEKHANFIINKRQATASDVLKLANLARHSVYDRFKIILQPEVNIVGI